MDDRQLLAELEELDALERKASGGSMSAPKLSPPEPESFVDRTALATDKVLKNLGGVLPDFLPSRQQLVDVAAGASEMGGMLRNAPRLQNVATESGARTVGRLLDPVSGVVGAKAYQAATMIPKVAKLGAINQGVVGGTAAGGAVGAMSGEPVEGAVMGGVMGGAIPGLSFLGGKAYDLASRIMYGAEGQVVDYLNKVFGGNRERVAQTLDELKALVPGEQPTTGLGAVSGPQLVPELKALSEGARKRLGAIFANRELENQAARSAPLEEIALPARRYFDADTGAVGLSQAEALRKQVTDPLYRIANPDQVALNPQLRAVLEAQQVAPLTSRAEGSIGQARANMGAGGRSAPAQGGAGYVPEGPNSFGMMPDTPFMPQDPTRTIGELQRVKDELSKRIKDIANASDTPSVTLRNQLIDARRQLTDSMKTQSGSYAMANQIFKNLSGAQNQGEVADVLLKALRSPTNVEREASFLRALQEAPQTLTKAGQKGTQDIREVMTPDQMREVINPITRSVRREADYDKLRASGESLPEMKGTLAKIEESSPPLLNRAVSIVRSAMKGIGAETDEAAQALLDRATLDPKELAGLLRRTPPAQRSELMNYVFRRNKELQQNPQVMGAMVGASVGAREQ